MNAASRPKTTATKPSTTSAWPAWTDRPIPYRLARPVADAQYQGEVDRLVRTRGGLDRLIGREAD